MNKLELIIKDKIITNLPEILSIDGENLQTELVFKFDDKFVDGTATLKYTNKEGSFNVTCFKDGETYKLPLLSQLAKKGRLELELIITQGTNEHEIPIYKTFIAKTLVASSILTDEEMPEEYPSWLEVANTKLNTIDIATEESVKQSAYAKSQGDYAKSVGDDLTDKLNKGFFKGEKGDNALINGVNTITINAGTNIDLKQQGGTLTINNTYEFDDTDIQTHLSSLDTTQQGLIEDVAQISEDLELYSLVSETGNKIEFDLDPTTFKLKAKLKNKNGVVINTSNEIDLPLESLVLSVSYDNTKKELVITLQNGTITRVPVGELISGLVNETQLNTKLADYVKNTDYAGGDKAGIIKTTGTYGITTNVNNGIIYAQIKTNEQYNSLPNELFISKGTLENVITGKGLTTKTYVDGEVSKVKSNVESSINDLWNDQQRQDNEVDKLNNEIDTLISILPKRTATGTNELNYDNAKAFNVLEGGFTGNEYQETTSGKNLANYNDKLYGPNFNIGDIKAGKDYSLYLNIDGYVNFNLKYGVNDSIITAKYNFTGKKVVNFTASKDSILFFNSWASDAGTLNGIPEIMLLEGTYTSETIGEYEPYTNGIAPNPEYPFEVETLKGWNLFDKDKHINAWLDDNKINFLSNGYSYYVPVEPNTTYRFTRKTLGTNNRGTIALANKFPEINDTIKILTSYTLVQDLIFTTQSDTKYVLMFLNRYSTDTPGEEIQLVKGDSIKPYLPYDSVGVKRTGKNLLVNNHRSITSYGVTFNFNKDGTYTLNGTNNGENNSYVDLVSITDKPLVLKAGKYYHIPANNSNLSIVLVYKKNGVNQYMGLTSTGTFTLTEETQFNQIYIQVKKGDTTTYNNYVFYPIFSVEPVSIDNYEPRIEQIDYIDLQGQELLSTDKLGYDVKGNVWLEKKWKKIDLSKGYYIGYEPSYKRVNIGFYSEIAPPFNSDNLVCKSNIASYKVGTTKAIYENAVMYRARSGGGIIVYIWLNNINSREEALEYFETEGKYFYYLLAEPEYINLGKIKPIKSLEGTNNVEILAQLQPTSMNETYVYNLDKELEELKNAVLILGGE